MVSKKQLSIKQCKKGSQLPPVPELPGPFSVLTMDSSIPLRDIEEWVNRTKTTRIQESVGKSGYITRPMNSFMLYRSTYAERAKAFNANNNHQTVSTLLGKCWASETDDVKERFTHLAKLERVRHAEAFPNYKFRPGKPNEPKRKRQASDTSSSNIDLGSEDENMHRVRRSNPAQLPEPQHYVSFGSSSMQSHEHARTMSYPLAPNPPGNEPVEWSALQEMPVPWESGHLQKAHVYYHGAAYHYPDVHEPDYGISNPLYSVPGPSENLPVQFIGDHRQYSDVPSFSNQRLYQIPHESDLVTVGPQLSGNCGENAETVPLSGASDNMQIELQLLRNHGENAETGSLFGDSDDIQIDPNLLWNWGENIETTPHFGASDGIQIDLNLLDIDPKVNFVGE